ncbi:putative F-box domain-containing protein [Arabidopsis thaliana]|uniref:F-box domain n=1 Tax=Arabidopsis thaliana x Arabidopsis arenosa TaxID=1240361 RepID=A0A8T2GUF3_9BRAS|nr:F-box domain [Arabidopsis thaliana x Arabidopsis arenosa]
MNLSGVKRLSEPLLLKNILMEESGDTCELTIVIMTVHAVMLESGFVLFDPDSSMRFSFSKKTFVSLNYTLPSVKGIVGLNFEKEAMFYVHIVDLLMETLKSDEEEDTLSIDCKVLVWWRMIKDGIVTPLLVDLCYKTGLELPPCFISLPRELKHKILESLPGVDIGTLACVSSELRDMAS